MIPSHDAHPVLACVRDIQTWLADVADLDPTFMPTKDKASALVVLSKALAAASALQARLLASAVDVAFDHGARDAAGWLAAESRGDYRRMRRALELGRSLESSPLVSGRWPLVGSTSTRR